MGQSGTIILLMCGYALGRKEVFLNLFKKQVFNCLLAKVSAILLKLFVSGLFVRAEGSVCFLTIVLNLISSHNRFTFQFISIISELY